MKDTYTQRAKRFTYSYTCVPLGHRVNLLKRLIISANDKWRMHTKMCPSATRMCCWQHFFAFFVSWLIVTLFMFRSVCLHSRFLLFGGQLSTFLIPQPKCCAATCWAASACFIKAAQCCCCSWFDLELYEVFLCPYRFPNSITNDESGVLF